MNRTYSSPRHKAREIAFQFIYRFDQETPMTQVFEEFSRHATHFECPQESFDFAARLAETTLKQLKSIDEMIVKYAQNWRIDRMNSVDKSILRMGVAELLFFKDVPASVTLNELVELAKAFGEADTPSFINGILDPISREPLALSGKVPSDS
jgi:N utilization substance protein B